MGLPTEAEKDFRKDRANYRDKVLIEKSINDLLGP